MALRLVQLRDAGGARCVAAMDDAGEARLIAGISTTYDLARAALSARETLEAAVAARISDESIDLIRAEREGRLLAPIDHPDAAHLFVTGTGLTHLGSAESRDRM